MQYSEYTSMFLPYKLTVDATADIYFNLDSKLFVLIYFMRNNQKQVACR